MTLTTEVLAQIKADIAARKAMPEFGESIEGNIQRLHVIGATRSHFSTETVEMLVNALDELLANREAQPVYQYRMRNPYNGQVTYWETIKPEQVDFIMKETIAANVEFRIIAAPPAPAVPEAISTRQAIIKMESHEPCDSINVAYKLGWNACRAAMLAQPVSSGYKLVPVDFLTTASRLIDLCRTYSILSDGGNYKERTISECESTMEVIDGLLAAAPEGGNG